MLQISTSQLPTRKKVEIDGHPYTVRKYGAGEQLALNQMLREVKKLEPKLNGETATDEELARAEELSIQMMNIFVGLFDDGVGGKKARQLVESLSQEEVQVMFSQIFEEENAGVAVS